MARTTVVAAVLLLIPATLRAQAEVELPIDVEVPAALVRGETQPWVKVMATEPVQNVVVTVTRKGMRRSFRGGTIGAGGYKTFRWQDRPGLYNYGIKVQGRYRGNTCSRTFNMELAYLEPIKMHLTRDRIDLAKRRLTFKLNHPAERAEIVVLGPQGIRLAESEESYSGARPGTPLPISWPAVDDEITRINLTAYGVAGHWTGMAIMPWSLSIPHEEVEFQTNRSEIRPSEEPKLDRAVELVQKALREHASEFTVNLYVGGYTDTVGKTNDNRRLSMDRARAIARYFAAHQVKIPIYYRGFGEEVLAVPTGDSVDEVRNRRATYVLANQPPSPPSNINWGGWRALKRGR